MSFLLFKKLITILTLSLFAEFSFCQIEGVVFDSITNNPVPYTNIWVEGENFGTTSGEDGNFLIPNVNASKILIFSAIGYKIRKYKCDANNTEVYLVPKDIKIPEVVINSSRKVVEKVIGPFKKNKISDKWSCSQLPVICARLFPYKEEYRTTPFIKSIKVLTIGNYKSSKFNIRLYSVDKTGEPGAYIYNKNIIVHADKGKKYTEKDISKLKLPFPKSGLYIGIEWLIIEQNKFRYANREKGKSKKNKTIFYEPSMGIIYENSGQFGRIYALGRWEKFRQLKTGSKRRIGKYPLLAIELTLTD